MVKNKNLIIIMAVIISVLSLIAALTGIFSKGEIDRKSVESAYGETIELYQKGLYARDSVSMAIQAKAQDEVTLVVAIPALIISVILIGKNHKKGLLFLAGMIGYFLYTYTSYAFLMFYNRFYLMYVAIMIVSFYAFILCISSLREEFDWKKVAEHFPNRVIGIFFIIAGFVICMMWLGRIVPTIPTGEAPYGLEHYSTLVIQSLDLGFIVPASWVTGYFLFQKNSWGYLLATVLLVKLVAMAAAVSAMAMSMYASGVPMNIAELFVFPIFTILGVLLLGKVLRSIA